MTGHGLRLPTPPIEIRPEPLGSLAEHATIPIAFEVTKILEPVPSGLGGITLDERPVETPWIKDYDALKADEPISWPQRFDTRHWGLIVAYVDGQRVGGAVIACRTPGLQVLRGRDDFAVLWDIRVHPEARSRGVGTALFRAAENWCRQRGCRELGVETQNINVPACRFYNAMGCVLSAIDTHAYYPDLPQETQLLWIRRLA